MKWRATAALRLSTFLENALVSRVLTKSVREHFVDAAAVAMS